MNIKTYNKVKNFKKVINDLFIKTMRFLLYPLLKYLDWYDKSDLKTRRMGNKSKKEIIKRLYSRLSRDGYLDITHCWINESIDYNFSIVTTNYNHYISFSSLKHYCKMNEVEILDYIVSVFRKDEDLIIEETTLKEYLGKRYYVADGRDLDAKVYKINVKDKI